MSAKRRDIGELASAAWFEGAFAFVYFHFEQLQASPRTSSIRLQSGCEATSTLFWMNASDIGTMGAYCSSSADSGKDYSLDELMATKATSGYDQTPRASEGERTSSTTGHR